ncbi:MAG: sigma-70 family RNA polymerase sigma factor [Muribaculaceae bacterium]|nr:sigma-70 family RNA polymerase sigma factor [Muribaculaceae bacterium]
MAQRWRKRAYETGLAYGATLDEADDIAQDTLLKLWAMRKELERYRSVEALAVVVARNQAIDLHRHRRTVSLDEVPEHLSLIERHAEAEMISREEVDWLQKRLAQLPPRQHTVLVMRQVEHRSYEEIASLLGIEATSAKALLSRARKWLLAQLTTENRLS